MKINEIITFEAENTSSIILHKEGLFWRAYEKSAFLFIRHIKEYQITKKYYKNVKAEIVYLGLLNIKTDIQKQFTLVLMQFLIIRKMKY